MALGVAPLADWLAPDLLDLDRSPLDRLPADRVRGPLGGGAGLAPACAPRRTCLGSIPAWRDGRRPGRCWPDRIKSRGDAPELRGADGHLGPGRHPGRPVPQPCRQGTAPLRVRDAGDGRRLGGRGTGPRHLRGLRGRPRAVRRCRCGCWPGCFGWCSPARRPNWCRSTRVWAAWTIPGHAWPVLRTVIAEHADELRAALEVPPQTNEVGRSVALLAGLFDVVAATGRPGRSGCSSWEPAPDSTCWSTGSASAAPGWASVTRRSPVSSMTRSRVTSASRSVHDRRAAGLRPAPDRRGQPGRPAAADLLCLAVRPAPAPTAGCGPAGWRPRIRSWSTGPRPGTGWPRQLDRGGDDEVLPVIWHSITQLYWPAAEIAGVDAVWPTTGRSARLARVAMEFGAEDRRRCRSWTTLWGPGVGRQDRRIGTAHHHGVPVRLRRARSAARATGGRPSPTRS